MKVAICVPCYGGTKSQFTHSLGRMLVHTVKESPGTEIELFFGSTSLLAKLRNYLAKQALDWGADWILWLDADHTFPPNTLLRLLAHNQHVVAVNYVRRDAERKPVAVRNGQLLHTSPESPELDPIDHCGLGICLVRADAVRALAETLFSIEGEQGEDVYFFRKLKAQGALMFVDSALSLVCGHVAEEVLSLTPLS
jgi:glycosyltransferase involved in cell wall biosynthesis